VPPPAAHPEITRLTEALVECERLAALGRLLAAVTHELKSPLEALSSALHLLQQHCSQDEKAGIYLKIAQQELARVSEISSQTLGFTRTSIRPIEVDVSATLQEIIKFYAHKIRYKQVKVATKLHADAKICAYPGQVRQIFSNLVINALEAVEKGRGRIVLRTRPRNKKQILGVEVVVADNGPGLPTSAKKIFEPFFTTKHGKGTGLGLWITHHLIKKNGGTIKLRSSSARSRHGVCIAVFLPQMPDRKAKAD
jgi:signal transduction histidine kinase